MNQIHIFLFFVWLLAFPAVSPALDEMTLPQLVEQTLEHFPDLKLADLNVEHVRQELPQIESQTGFVLSGKSGYSRDLSFIGTPSDNFSVAGELKRTLRTGERIGLSTSYRREDNSGGSFFPGYPNPASTINIDLNYRKPFWRDNGNPDLNQNLIIAGKQVEIAEANRKEQREQLASQAIDLFYAALSTRYRIDNSRLAIERARRLEKYVNERVELGLSEKKDQLQTKARLRAEQAAYHSLQLVWKQQRIMLNRLVGQPWNNDIRLSPSLHKPAVTVADMEPFFIDAQSFSPALMRGRGRLEIADALIEQQRNRRKDMLDLVVSAGVRNLAGDSGKGSVNSADWAGGVSIEYQRGLERRGFDAALYQARLERERVIQEMESVRYQLRYRLSSLVAEIVENQKTVESYRRRLESETLKYRESERLYRSARLDTNQLLQHEAELQAAELALHQQRVALLERYARLALLRGKLYR